MAIDPRVIANAQQREAGQIADLGRRVTALEALRTQIGPDSITGASIAPNSITTVEIAANTITAGDIAANTITGNEIQANSITASDIAANTITAGQIAANTITASQIAANTITASQIAANTITAAQIAAATITASQIAAGTITASLLAANSVTANAILAGSIDATKIATDTITANQIAAGAITASELAANSVTASAILAGAVTATKISVTDLGSITSNMGSITAGTITGGTIQTAASGSRVVMDSAGLRGYALDGVTKVFEVNAGSGIASFTGVANIASGSVVPAFTIASGGSNGTIGGSNMLSNASFEDSTLAGWVGNSATIAAETTTVRTSATSVKVTTTSAGNVGLGVATGSAPATLLGNHYIASAWVYSTTAFSFRIYAQTLTAANATVDTASAVTAVPANTWTRIFSPVVTPTGAAVKTRVLVYTESGTLGQIYYVDDVQLEQGDVPTAFAPKAGEILPGAIPASSINMTIGGYNLLNNTQFSNVIGGTNGWTRGGLDAGLVTVTSPLKYAPRTLQVGATTASTAGNASQISNLVGWTDKGLSTAQNLAPIEAGKTYTASFWIRGDAANTTTSLQANIRIFTYLADGSTNIDSVTGTVQTYNNTSWTRIKLTYQIPPASTAVLARVLFYPDYGLGATLIPAGNKYYISGPQFEEGDTVTAYTPKADEITPLSVGANELTALSITAAKIAANTIGAGQIQADSITANEIASNAITVNELAANSVNASKIVANSITASQIAANTITAGQIAANTITAGQIAANTITSTQIAAGAITTNTIAAGAVTASKLTVDWGGANMIWDSSFEDNTSSPGMWQTSVATLSRPNADIIPVSGGRVLKAVATATFPISIWPTQAASVGVDPNTGTGPYGPNNSFPGYYPILRGKQYTFSGYVSSPAVIRNASASISWWDGLLRQRLPAPATPSVVGTTGGTLTPSTTYYYRVTAINANGQTTGSTQTSVGLTAGQNAATLTITAPADAQGTDYPVTKLRIYRSTVSGTFTAGYIEITAVGGAVTPYTDTGTALTAGALPSTNTALTVARLSDTGTSVPTELPTTAPNPPITTSPTVVTGPFVVTGAAGGTLWSRWVRPYITAVPPTGAAYGLPEIDLDASATGEVHYFDAFQMERGDIPTGYNRRTGEVLPGEVGATQITPNSITTNQVLAAGINADRLTAASITATQIQANTIDASKMTVATLSAITANMGTITAGTITGATFQTAASGARVVFNATGINAYDASAVNTFNLSSTGSLTMIGKLNATGVDFTEPVTNAFAWTPPTTAKVRWLDSGLAERSAIVADWISATTPVALNIHRLSLIAQDRVLITTNSLSSNGTSIQLIGDNLGATAGSIWIRGSLNMQGYTIQNAVISGATLGSTTSSSIDMSTGAVIEWLASGLGGANAQLTEAYGNSFGFAQATDHCTNIRSAIYGTNSGGTGTATGWYYWTGGGAGWSSIKGKKDVVNLTDRVKGLIPALHGRGAKPEDHTVLAKVRRLSAKHYNKSTKPPGHDLKLDKIGKSNRKDEDDWKPQIGFIAEEIEQEFPDLVETWEPTEVHPEGMKWMDSAWGLSAVLLEAIKELADKVDTLEAALAAK